MEGTIQLRDVCIPKEDQDLYEYLSFLYEMDDAIQRGATFQDYGSRTPFQITAEELWVRLINR
jgi:hypothetical protein